MSTPNSSEEKNNEPTKVIYPDFIYEANEPEETQEEEDFVEKKSFLQAYVYPRLLFFLLFSANAFFTFVFFLSMAYSFFKALFHLFGKEEANASFFASFFKCGLAFIFTIILSLGVIHPKIPMYFMKN